MLEMMLFMLPMLPIMYAYDAAYAVYNAAYNVCL